MHDLAGHAALVTGGGTGIGFACAERLIADGAVVTICGRRTDVLDDAVRVLGPNARAVRCDVTSDDDVARAVQAAAEPLGHLDIVVANAGGSAGPGTAGPLVLTELEGWRAIVDLYLVATWSTLRHSAPLLVRSGRGSLVAVSTVGAHLSHRHTGPYSAAKAGVEMLVRTAADELGRFKVRVNAVRPGLVATEMTADLVANPEVCDGFISKTPLGRMGEPSEVAEAVRFLAGPESAWITGALLDVDGGQHLRGGADLGPTVDRMFESALLERLGVEPA